MKKLFLLLLHAIFIFSFSDLCSQEYWEKISSPTEKFLRHVFFVDNQTGWCAGEQGIIIHTTDGGMSWAEQNSMVNSFIVSIFFLDENMGWALTLREAPPFGTTILRTTNGGDDWAVENYPDDNVFLNTIVYFDSANGLLGGSKIVRTTDGGITWLDVDIDSTIVSNLPVFNFNFYNRRFGYACGGYIDLAGVIWRTTDYGLSWHATAVSPDQVFDLFVIDSLNALTLSGDPEGFFGVGDIKTTDAGDSWSYTELPIHALSFAIDFRTTDEGWSASGFKFIYTPDKGNTWIEKQIPDSSVIYDLVFTDSTTGYAVGERGTILKYLNEPPVPVDTIPSDFILYQNYPNPFYPNTMIKYTVPQPVILNDLHAGTQEGNIPVPVLLKVYDVLGNEIATLVNEEKPPGNYSVEFKIINSALSSGIYFYTLTAGKQFASKKMICLK
jgi:photosystem II stability/assembly factor-like uncharacterized protein